MNRINLVGIILAILAGCLIAFVSYRYGIRVEQRAKNHSEAFVQAMLAFAHYKANERIETLVLRKCYEAALTEAREQKNLQLKLLADNFQATNNDAELAEYIRLRDREALETILAGGVPEPKPYTTNCP